MLGRKSSPIGIIVLNTMDVRNFESDDVCEQI